jgi:hypothetical protein
MIKLNKKILIKKKSKKKNIKGWKKINWKKNKNKKTKQNNILINNDVWGLRTEEGYTETISSFGLLVYS